MCGKEEDRWLFASPSPDGFAFQAATQATTRLPPLVVLITRGMTTLTRAKRTSRIVSFLMVFGITGRISGLLRSPISFAGFIKHPPALDVRQSLICYGTGRPPR